MRPTILVCDNEAPLRELVRATLDDGRFDIVEARDGEEALELIRRERPDVVVLDVMMPGKTGFDVLAEVRANAELAQPAVVMLTARAQLTDRHAAEDRGADRFLAKPFSPLALVQTVEELLEPRA
jgi:DNA-binding response OmpR family regulator